MIRQVSLLTFLTTLVASDSFTNFPVSGACQARCLKEYGQLKEKTTSRGTLYKEFDITNNTDFSLCKLGCTSPSFNELPLPAFKFGQEAHFSILELPHGIQAKLKAIDDVSLLCVQNTGQAFSNSTLSLLSMYGKAYLRPSIDAEHQPIVHHVEVVAHDESRIRTEENSGMVVVFHEWCYTPTCPVSISMALTRRREEKISLQLRVSSFNANGNIGGVIVSQWYSLDTLLQKQNAAMDVVDTRWLDDKAAVELSYAPDGASAVPVCTMNVAFRNTIQSHYREQTWAMDFTRGVLLRNLDFGSTYSVKIGRSNFTAHSYSDDELVASATFDVPACMTLVNDPSMCAPPPVSHLWSAWNTTAKQTTLALSWAYTATEEQRESATRPVTMSHFIVSIQPLVTPANSQCQHLEPIRRDITWTHRRVIFYVTDSKCNYEAEVIAVDMKKRHSSSKKIQISRSDDPTSMLLRAETWNSPLGLIVIAGSAAGIGLIIGLLGCRFKERRQKSKRKGNMGDLDSNRVVYAFSQVDNSGNKTVVGTRYFTPPGSDRTTSTAASDPAWLFTASKDRALHGIDNIQWVQNQSTMAVKNGRFGNNIRDERYNWEPTEVVRMGDDENCYETIGDYGVPSELSEEEVPYLFYHDSHDKTVPYETLDTKQVSLPKIATTIEFGNMPAISIERLMRQKLEPATETADWSMVKVIDRLNERAFVMKYARDATSADSLRRELQILDGMQHTECFYHENIVRLAGLASHNSLNPLDGYEVRGILFEPIRGGTLRKFIQRAGSAIRRMGLGSEPTPPPMGTMQTMSTLQRRRILSTPPSSGYDGSARGSGATSPEATLERAAACIASRFCHFGEELSSALNYLHGRNVLHTHVTTLNIYLVAEYNDPLDVPCDQSVKLGDFGWADSAGIDSSILVDDVIAPPEVLAGKCYDAKGDVYQFGMCLAEMASLGTSCQVKKSCGTSSVEKFDATDSARTLCEIALKCLVPRGRISAAEAERQFKAFAASRQHANQTELEHINQSVLV